MHKSGRFSQWLNEYWLNRKVANSRWKSMQNFIFYVYIILWYDQNSITELQPNFWVVEMVEPPKKQRVQCGSIFCVG